MTSGYIQEALVNRLARYLVLATCKFVLALTAGAQMTPPTVTPSDGSVITPVLLPVFTWQRGSESLHRLRIVELGSEQSVDERIIDQAAILDLVVAGTIYHYSPFDPPLDREEPQRYAWIVTTIDAHGVEHTEGRVIATFTVDDSPMATPSTGGDAPRSLVDCHCGTLRFILPPTLCALLGGTPFPTTDGDTILADRPTRPVVEWIDPPHSIDDTGTSLRIGLRNVDGCAMIGVSMRTSAHDATMPVAVTMTGATEATASVGSLPATGAYLFEVVVTNLDGTTVHDRFTAVVGENPPHSTASPLPYVGQTNTAGALLSFVTDADVADAERRAREAGARADEARARRNRQVTERDSLAVAAADAIARARELIRIDKVLDRIPDAYRGTIDSLLHRLDSLRRSLGGAIDTNALDSAVASAKARRDDCRKTRQDLEREKSDLEEQRDRLKKEQDDLLKQMDALHSASDGWSGSSGYHADGTVHWGYIRISDGTSGWDSDHNDRYYDLRKEIRTKNKAYKESLKRLKELEQELSDADRDCDEREQAVLDAEAARARGDQAAAVQNELDELCRQIRSMLKRLKTWCIEHPDLCDWDTALEDLLRECPEGDAGWEEFWGSLASIISQKQARERELGDRHDSLEREVTKLDSSITKTEKEIDDHEDEKDEEWRKARKLRDQQAVEAMERRRNEEAARRAGAAAEVQRRIDCYEGFARWIAANQQHVDQSDLDALQKIVDGAQIGADAAGSYAGGMAKGSTAGVSGMNAVATGLFGLGTTLFYAWMESTLKNAVKQIADQHVLNILAASLLTDKRSCGVIQGTGLNGEPSTTSFYFFRKGNQVLIFRISATHGFECLGTTNA